MADQIEYITCRQCGKTEPLTKKFRCNSCGTKNWGYKLKKGKSVWWDILAIMVLLIGIGAYLKIKEYRNAHWSKSEIETSFSPNVALIYHEFAFEVEFDDPAEEPIYFIKNDDGSFSQWQKGMHANSITGCGLIFDKNGECVTTSSVAHPWLSDWDMINLKRELNIFRQAPFNVRSGGHIKLFTIKLGYYQFGAKYETPASFVDCSASGDWEEGISSLKAKSHFESSKKMATFYHAQSAPYMLIEDKIYIAGYPLEMKPGENLSPLVTESKIDSIKGDGFYCRLNTLYTLEGAPVFNEKGELIGLSSLDDKGNMKIILTRFEMEKSDK